MRILTITSGATGMKRQIEAISIALINSFEKNNASKEDKCDIEDIICTNSKYYWFLFFRRFIHYKISKLFKFSKLNIDDVLINSKRIIINFNPDIIISCGRKAGMASRLYKYYFSPFSKLVHVEDPRIGYKEFDLILLPAHDKNKNISKCTKVVKIYGAFSPFVEHLLQEKVDHVQILKMKSPKRCILIGGSGKGLKMDNAWVDKIVLQMKEIQIKFGGEWAITFSRRTNNKISKRFYSQIKSSKYLNNNVWIWSFEGNNPYASMLNCADEIIVSIDSTSMLLQASATKANLFLLDMHGKRKKIARLTKRLIFSGRATWFNDSNKVEKKLSSEVDYKAWDSTLLACYEINKLLGINSKINNFG